MEKRKIIGCLINHPEYHYQTRVLKGIMNQCEAYGYDLAVFSPMVDTSHFYKDFLRGDQNIFSLANYEYLDAVILVSLPLLAHSGDKESVEVVKKLLAQKCKKPVVVIDFPVDDYDVIETDDVYSMAEMTDHVIDVHGCNPDNIYVLTGYSDNTSSIRRLEGCKHSFRKHGYELKSENIFYGDFWYPSGYELAEKIISGEVARPEAIIVHSDHMAIGLINRLVENGIRVPEDIIVTGFDAAKDGVINKINVSSYVIRVSEAAAKAVDHIRGIIEPGSPLVPYTSTEEGLRPASSCGCSIDSKVLSEYLQYNAYNRTLDYSSGVAHDNNNMTLLLESYMMEELTRSETLDDCLRRINSHVYLMRPYNHFYLCLRENWLDMNVKMVKGYSQTMCCVVHQMPEEAEDRQTFDLHVSVEKKYVFPSKIMLPQLHDERKKPNVFYFVPVHFQENTLGYAVLQCEMSLKFVPTCMFRNWMRYVNSGLEMVRIRNKLISVSISESMTGLYNRRGMELKVKEMFSNADEGDSCFVMLVDMDGLKTINDKFGHGEGDNAIIEVSSVTRSVLDRNEIAVRAGGDEFYIIGVGKYDEQKIKSKVGLVEYYINEKNRNSTKGYDLSVSIGYHICLLDDSTKIEQIIKIADEAMYVNKVARKKNRK